MHNHHNHLDALAPPAFPHLPFLRHSPLQCLCQPQAVWGKAEGKSDGDDPLIPYFRWPSAAPNTTAAVVAAARPPVEAAVRPSPARERRWGKAARKQTLLSCQEVPLVQRNQVRPGADTAAASDQVNYQTIC